ncbi:NtaA/DmoA family FMN-dependent monooxygenase [Marinobacterium iners]|uniref:FMN-dependent oxidoreductase, nitrilotriacetate monooxygenase family n=1 Tax=Marinobacterium iners DSM 11526 TaxID=1122198 RepID=A0A1H3XZD6_9GAMM|nr:NtaA/DmoA family FMN-dependent monooxygenase [Marinobacterium iners]SEA03974.1 FMN-dependent oxidoreductase, nitrilotriacetate monooxygenase family [Marinobacterium iners DSM 11526]
MNTTPPLCIGLSLAVTWLSGNGWRRADSQVEGIYSAGFYTRLAQLAEQACLDFLFRPDSLFIEPATLEQAPGFSSLDPTLLLTAIARETSHIGLVTTASTTFNSPYLVARQLQSLSWLSNGRAGWNVVTALDGQRNFGLEQMPAAAERYARAQEFVDVVQQLWDSYPDTALLAERRSGQYADSGLIRPIQHQGVYFKVEGPLSTPMHGSGRVPLFQAGASPEGRDFAARIADAIFAATPDIHAGVELRQDIRTRAQHHGRSPGSVRVLPGLSLYLASSRAEARDLFEATQTEDSRMRKLKYLQTNLGLDPTTLPPDQPITADLLQPTPANVRSRTHAGLLRRLILRESPSLNNLLQRPEVSPSAHWQVIGTSEDALQAILERYQAGAADGFIALPGGAVQSLELVCAELVPALADLGLFRQAYQGTSLREHLGLPY